MGRKDASGQAWKDAQYAFFAHRQCEYFPCHPGADPDNFNCLFCYCPLYALGRRCGGRFRYLKSGVKDCTLCLFPHLRENYGAVVARYGEIMALIREREAQSAGPQDARPEGDGAGPVTSATTTGEMS